MTAPRLHVLIAGAGIGGLTAAIALLRRGHDVDLYEQAPALGELGAGVQLAANGTRVLIALGLRDALERVVCPAAGKEVRLWSTGQTWPLFDLGTESEARFGAPYWMAHRGDLHRVLVDAVRALKPDAIHLGAAAVGCDQDSGGATLRFADGATVRGDVLVGADGVHSRIRHALFGSAQPSFTGIMAWRGLAPMARLPAHLRRPVGSNFVGPGGHVVTYPLRRGEILNFVGIVERDDWRAESWNDRGTVEECAGDFRGWHADVHTIIGAVDVPFKWALIGREPLDRWSDGRICLIGDACHPTLPFLAQGANMALEDGLMLARALELEEPPAVALARFGAARAPRCARIVRGSLENGKRFHNPALADAAGAATYVDREWAPDKVAARYDWLFEYDATAIPM